ncbi:hypothetical protein J7384_00345 [Endozoicomonas sp. G2_1]|uniref:hypothetical protein n=1 Tax=Endozoicomonas sp. G2_1 TaxID=2821091 RepID=UPI001ADB8DA9|nr:hypothetical protein [Endozoicomonas sp. G2_1]MBO9488808.1 hypothetical protein [Endozoicomonas sp. G2_1]
MQKKSLLISLSVCFLTTTSIAHADLFDKLKNKSEQAAKKLIKQGDKKQPSAPAQPTASATATNSDQTISLGDGPSENLTKFTKCAGLDLSNVMVGEYGDYTFQQGFSTEERSGLVNRSKHQVSSDCILPSLKPLQVVYMEVDTEKYDDMGYNWTMQCVRSDKPQEGVLKEARSEYPVKVTYLAGKDIMLHCGHSEEHVEACAEGSNGSRSRAWDDVLDSRGKTMLTVLAKQSMLAPKGGEKLYCQYYNKKTKTSLFGFEYIRTPFN